jgi:hypothetical protein
MIANQYFVIVVPKSVIMILPEEVGQMFVDCWMHMQYFDGILKLLSNIEVSLPMKRAPGHANIKEVYMNADKALSSDQNNLS